MKIKAIASLIALSVTALTSQPAYADISALYSAGTDDIGLSYRMTVEVADSGAARLHVTGRTVYFLIVDGDVYTVERGVDGVFATRLSDLNWVVTENESVGGIRSDLIDELQETGLKNIGNRSVLGRDGIGFAEPRYHDDDDDELLRPDLVISQDKELKPIGAAIAQALDGRYGVGRTMSLVGIIGSLALYVDETAALLKSGTPIKLGSLLLTKVSNEDIDNSRFELPERIITLEQLREMYRPFKWSPQFDWQPKG